MASLALSASVTTQMIKTTVERLPPTSGSGYDLAVYFSGLSADEMRTLVDCAIKIEQARTGNVLTPTEYRNRFSGLDFDVE